MVSIVNAVRDLGRLRQIYVVLVRHGFGELAQRLGLGGRGRAQALPELPAGNEASDALVEAPEDDTKRGEEERRRISLPERVRLVCMDLGPSFVKLGQIASTRPDVLPNDWILELKKLQDEVNPLPWSDIKGAVEASLGAPIEDVYEGFEEKPLAAASIGQVHRAVLKHADGPQEVVVKVQRPGVRTTVARDLELLHALAKLIERTIPESALYQPSALVDQFDRAITSELDFALEAEHAEKFARNFAGHPHARFPRVYREASSKTVLTLELLPGGKVYDEIRHHGHKGPAIAQAAVGIVVKMIFEDGFFHADPHPGNILISGDPDSPTIGLIDLGMVGRLSPEMRDKTLDLMIAAVRQDHLGVADALYAIGTPTKKIDMRAYRAEVSLLAEKYVGRPLKEIDVAAMISDLMRGAAKYGIEIPPDFLLVGKAIMTIEGVGKEIDPDLDVFGVARPFFLDLLRKRYSPERIGMELWRGVERLSGAAYDMPQQLREIFDDLRLGRLTLRTTDPTLPRTVDRLGRRLFAGLVVATFVFAGTWLLQTDRKDPLGITLLVFGVLVMFGHVVLDVLRHLR
ncbi:ABC1 kinase family protein [Polyangium sorediatum]|uniref:AarF/ABC1/UbiB kinase family protein n=1 Tax=Polyangium sorediatum TaxID=889274 RepID=A0ABT6NQR0_9BACT|nr:AarF/ABC1/UbiB kinase family protein [Polyangium sorediatum]MDI1430671.1 AarF/ABC1/UbiB kinase family protein [Polyangium sorediatum]